MSRFEMKAVFEPAGHQPVAIEALARAGIETYDDESGALINSADLTVFRSLSGKAAGPTCPTCPSASSRCSSWN